MELTTVFQAFLPGDLFPTLPTLLFGIGVFIRSSDKISSHLIPSILCVIGSLASIFLTTNGLNGVDITIGSVIGLLIQNIGSGSISAFISIGMHQLISQSGINIGTQGYNKLDEMKNINLETGETK